MDTMETVQSTESSDAGTATPDNTTYITPQEDSHGGYDWLNIIYYAAFLPLGFLGNLLCVIVVGYIVRHQASRRNVPDILVGFLSAVELFSILSFHSISVVAMVIGKWVFPHTICTIQAICVGLYLKLEFLVQVCIYVDRYLALTKPFRYQQCSSSKLVRMVIIVIIVVSIITSTLMIVTSYPGVRLLTTWYLCVYQLDSTSIAPNCVLGVAYLLFVIGFILVIVCNLHLVKNLCRYHGLGSSNIIIHDLTDVIQAQDKDTKIPPHALLELANSVVMSHRHSSSGAARSSTPRSSSSVKYGNTLTPDPNNVHSREKTPQFLDIPHQKPRASSVNATTDAENVNIFHHLNSLRPNPCVSEGCLRGSQKSIHLEVFDRQKPNAGLVNNWGTFRSNSLSRTLNPCGDHSSEASTGIVITVDEPSTSDPRLDSVRTQSTELLNKRDDEDEEEVTFSQQCVGPPRIVLNGDLRRSQSLASLSPETAPLNPEDLPRRESWRSTCSVKTVTKRNSILSKSLSVDDGLNKGTSSRKHSRDYRCSITPSILRDNHSVSLGRPTSPLVRESYIQRQMSKVLRLVDKALRRQKREIVLARIVLLNACVFVLTWLPFIIASVFTWFGSVSSPMVGDICLKLVFSNAVLNPLFHGLCRSNYRKGFAYTTELILHYATCKIVKRPNDDRIFYESRKKKRRRQLQAAEHTRMEKNRIRRQSALIVLTRRLTQARLSLAPGSPPDGVPSGASRLSHSARTSDFIPSDQLQCLFDRLIDSESDSSNLSSVDYEALGIDIEDPDVLSNMLPEISVMAASRCDLSEEEAADLDLDYEVLVTRS